MRTYQRPLMLAMLLALVIALPAQRMACKIDWADAPTPAVAVAEPAAARALGPDDDLAVQKQALFALAQMGTPEALRHLADIAAHHRHPEMRKQAVFWIGQQPGDAPLRILQTLFAAEASARVQKQIVFAIGQTDHPDRVPVLVEIARSQAPKAVRKQAVHALGQTRDPRARAALVALLRP